MRLLLGCVATDIKAALQLQEILAGSEIAITLHTDIPQLERTLVDDSAFHIVVLGQEPLGSASECNNAANSKNSPITTNSADPLASASSEISIVLQARQALDWFISHDALRCLISYSSDADSDMQAVKAIADDWLAYQTADQTHWMAHWPKTIKPLVNTSCNNHALLTIGNDTIQAGVQAIHDELQTLPPEATTHVQFDCAQNDEASLLTVTRGTEAARLLAGPPQIAYHLAALFRMRGWLTSAHQLNPGPRQGSTLSSR